MLLVTLSIITIIKLNDKKEVVLDNVKLKESINNTFALMLEQSNGTYEESTDTEWPSEGYTFNSKMSGCVDSNGNTLENALTYKNGAIKLKTRTNAMCYIYFDIDRPATEEILATVTEEQLWDSTLEDDGIRYVGTNPNNYICFGTTDKDECTSDTDKYMYRIIGIFEDSNGTQHLKLIKKEALNTAYQWHSDYQTDVDWDESDLYKGINGEYFATNSEYSYMQDSAWNNLITTWNYTATNTKSYSNYLEKGTYGLHYALNIGETIYLHEMNKNIKKNCLAFNMATSSGIDTDCNVGEWENVLVKMGLMYIGDYFLSLGSSALMYISGSNNSTLKTGWMHISNNDNDSISENEWTMTRYDTDSVVFYSYHILSLGNVAINSVGNSYSVRPVFYLESDTKLKEGNGTIDNPYTIETSPNLREYCSEYNNINECIKNEENNIEEVKDLWDSTLEEDGYRYVGTNPNNYVCFGTTNANECTSDTDKYMYRIIGIFEDEEGTQHLKLIKKEALNQTYAWHSDYRTDTDWEESDLYKGINGSYFLNNTAYSYMQNNTWLNKIETWKYTLANTKTYENFGPNYRNNIIENIYLHEMNRSSKSTKTCINYNNDTGIENETLCTIGEWKIFDAKISLMYVNDYLLSLGNNILGYKTSDYREILKTGWMYIVNNDNGTLSNDEWSISRDGAFTNGTYCAWRIVNNGGVYANGQSDKFSSRPVFYLTENIKITSGKGSITEPFIIS